MYKGELQDNAYYHALSTTYRTYLWENELLQARGWRFDCARVWPGGRFKEQAKQASI